MVLARLEGAESGLIVQKPISSVVFQFGGALLVQAELCFFIFIKQSINQSHAIEDSKAVSSESVLSVSDKSRH